MTAALTFEVSERFREAAGEWADQRLKEPDEAFEEKVEQALLEIEHLVSGATAVEFGVADGTVRYEPTPALDAFLDEQAAATGLEKERVLALHVDLFARVYLDSGDERPPNAPPLE